MRIPNLITGRTARRSYVGELELAIQRICCANHDKNPNRYTQIAGWTKYGLSVAIARRSGEPIPERPDEARMV